MKKRVFSLLMALVLCFSLLPTAALAEDADAAQEIQNAGGDVENTGDIENTGNVCDSGDTGNVESPGDAEVPEGEDTGDIDDTETQDDKAQDAGDGSAPDAGVPDGEADTIAPVTLAEPEENAPVALANDADKPQGEGTAEAPYLIGTLEELQWFRDTVNGGTANICAKLTADIALGNTWTPIGNSGNAYTGTFNGGGHKITAKEMTANTQSWGLFGSIGAGGTVQALTVNVGTFTVTADAAQSGLIAAQNAGTIERCTVSIYTKFNFKVCFGLIAYENSGLIENCRGSMTQPASYDSDAINVAGIAYANSGTVKSCYFHGQGRWRNYAVDYAITSSLDEGTVENCYCFDTNSSELGNRYLDETREGIDKATRRDSSLGYTLASGQVAWLLNNGKGAATNNTEPWRQETATNGAPTLDASAGRVTKNSDGTYTLETPHTHWVNGALVEFAALDGSNPSGSGNYYLSEDVTLGSTWTITGDTTLCLNSKTLTTAESTNIVVESGTLTLLCHDTKNAAGTINGTGGSCITVSGGTLAMQGGTISNANGTGVTLNSGGFAMQGGEISGCGTGVSVQGGTLTLSGSAKVSENTNQNILLGEGQTISFGTLNAGAKFGISVAGQDGLTNRVAVTDKTGGQYHGQLAADGFKADGAGFELYPNEDGTISLGKQSVHTHCICGTTYTNAGHTAHSNVTFLPWTATDSLPQEGNYYLTRNVTLTSDPTLKSANICLNGYTVTLSQSTTRIKVGSINNYDNQKGSLTDCAGKGTITGGGVFIEKGGTVGLYGGTLNGTQVVISQTGDTFNTFNLFDGKITNNQMTAVVGQSSSTDNVRINMYGGEISGNQGASNDYGGGVFVGQSSQFAMSGGKITDNSAVTDGGGVYISAADASPKPGTFTMSGGEISGNTATGKGGGVYVGGAFNVSGDVTITGNKVGDSANNVYLPGNKTITVTGEPKQTIGVTTGATPADGKPVQIAAGVGSGYTIKEADKDRFTPDAGNVYRSVYKDGSIYLEVPPHEHPVNGGTSVTWTPINNETELRAITAVTEDSCCYYLTQDITLNGSSWAPVNGIVLDLNGKSITAKGEFDTITVNSGVRFTLTDCKGGGENYGAITHEMANLSTRYNGRGVTVSADGEFTMYGGHIGPNLITSTDTPGVGVYVAEGAAFTMLGGVISGNSSIPAKKDGGGLWTAGTAAIGGDAEITGNFAQAGGGVYVSGGTLTLQGSAAVKNNSSTNGYNSGIFVSQAGQLCVSGSVQVTDNGNGNMVGNVYLEPDSDKKIKAITVIGELTDASIKVSFLDETLNTISDHNPMTIAQADTAGWIKDDSFVVDCNTAYELHISEDGKTANLGPHIHQWKYTVSPDGHSITAACANTSCSADGGKVTISIDEDRYTYDGSKRPAQLTGEFTTGAATPTVAYTLLKDKEYIALPDGETVPINAGQYRASITMKNTGANAADAIASVDYAIDKATLTADDFTFTRPANLTYDGNPKIAAVTTNKTGVGLIRVTNWYAQGGGFADDACGVGSYVVRIQVEDSRNYNAIPNSITGENWTFKVTPTDQYTVHTPDSWKNEIEVIEGSKLGDMILAITKNGADTVTVTGVEKEPLAGTVSWYTDEACTKQADYFTSDKFEGVGSTVKLYWKFVFNNDDPQNQNYVTEDKTGSVTFRIKAGAQQGLIFKDAGGEPVTAGTKKYGNWSFILYTPNDTDAPNQVSIAYASSNPDVAKVQDNGDRSITVTICGVGTTTITATAARVDGQYAETTATYTLTVEKGVWELVYVSMSGYAYYGNVPTPSLFNYSSGDPSAVTYYYSTTNTNSGGMKWENIGPTTLQSGTYYMYAEIAETANYKAYTTTASSFTVYKAYPICSAPTGLTATYGQTLNDITLTNPEGNTPGTWRWKDGTQPVSDASDTPKAFKAVFTPTDTVNYETMLAYVDVTVNPAAGGSLGTVELKLPYADTAEHTCAPDWSGLPKGQTWNYACEYSVSTGSNAVPSKKDMDNQGKLTYAISNGKAGDVVTFTLKARCNNYEDFTVTVNITIEKAKPTGTPGYTKITSGGQTLADAKLTLTGSDITVPGTVQWVADDGVTPLADTTKVEVNKIYKWLFTPTDTDN